GVGSRPAAQGWGKQTYTSVDAEGGGGGDRPAADAVHTDPKCTFSLVEDVFCNENMDSYREYVLNHMKELWINWRSGLLRYNVTNKKTTIKAAFNRKPPNGLDEKEWKWLIKEVYSSEDFKKVSARNSANRVHYPKELAHRTGTKPFRQVIWKDLGGNKGMKPKLVDIFHSTRKKGTSLPNVETAKKLDEIRETMKNDPSLSDVQSCMSLVGRVGRVGGQAGKRVGVLVDRYGKGCDGLVGRVSGQVGRGWVFWWAGMAGV
ncbi:Lebercilin-like protein, partial [Bienertia sinuspersici]